MVPKVSALENADLNAPHRYLKHMSATSTKFLEASEAKEVTQKLLKFAESP